MALSADIRRVVTTVDKNDKAVVLIDGPTPHKKVRPHAQTVSRLLWVTDQTPADLSGTKDRAAIDWFLAHTSAGSTVINHNLIQSGTNPRLPFGGVGPSGTGRIGGEAGFREFSNARSVVEQPLGLLDTTFNFPPYSKTYRKLVEKALG